MPETNPNIIQIRSGLAIDKTATTFKGLLERAKVKRDGGWGVYVIGGIECIGVLQEFRQGCTYELEGSFIENKPYAKWEFKFRSYKCQVDSARGIQELLVREAPGLGATLATSLCRKYGKDTLSTIISDISAVALHLKFPVEKAEALRQWALGEQSNATIKTKLYAIGITPSQVAKLIAKYGNDAETKIRQDCFSLTEIKGFGFKTVAAIADLIGIPQDDPGRLKAALKYTVEQLLEEGHTCIPITEVFRVGGELTGMTQQKLKPILDELVKDGGLLTEEEDWETYREREGIVL